MQDRKTGGMVMANEVHTIGVLTSGGDAPVSYTHLTLPTKLEV